MQKGDTVCLKPSIDKKTKPKAGRLHNQTAKILLLFDKIAKEHPLFDEKGVLLDRDLRCSRYWKINQLQLWSKKSKKTFSKQKRK